RSSDLYKGNISQWKKFGNSLLLRLGMRYSKLDPAKAEQIAKKAVDPARGGVMSSNDDNAIIDLNETFTNGTSNYFTGSERGNFYAGAPFVEHMQATNDPRMPVFFAKYEHPARSLSQVGSETTDPSDQIGMPYGYDSGSIEDAPGFPGKPATGGFKYSQLNRRTILRADAPMYILTYAQTQVLLAEAAARSWISVSPSTYYQAGIKGH